MGTVIQELGSLPKRIRTSADRIESLRKDIANELEIRDGLIVEAVDHAGMGRKAAAEAARVSYSYIIRILSGSSDDD